MKPRGGPRKLDDAQVERVREWYAKLSALPVALEFARELGVDPSLLYRIGKGLAYKKRDANG